MTELNLKIAPPTYLPRHIKNLSHFATQENGEAKKPCTVLWISFLPLKMTVCSTCSYSDGYSTERHHAISNGNEHCLVHKQ